MAVAARSLDAVLYVLEVLVMPESVQSTRAGHYAPQPGGYQAFVPMPLPPDPPLHMDDQFQALLSQADRALGRLDGSIQTLPDPDLFVLMYVKNEALLSSQIEGTQSSLDNLLEAEANVFDPLRPHDVDEVINYVAAMNLGLARLADLPVSVRLIREIHERLLQNVRGAKKRPGELRTEQNWIGAGNSPSKQATFIPPPPDLVPQALADLEKFLHSPSPMPVLIKIGLAHAQFETIHPFLDSNGRVGRLLITFLLCERNVLDKPVLYLSHYFKANRQEYYDSLQAVRNQGDWERWLTFFLRGVVAVAQEATTTARRIVALREAHRSLILKHFGRTASSGLTLLESLYSHPIVMVNKIASVASVSYEAANNLARRFVEHGLFVERTGQARNRRFVYDPYIAIFRGTETAPMPQGVSQ